MAKSRHPRPDASSKRSRSAKEPFAKNSPHPLARQRMAQSQQPTGRRVRPQLVQTGQRPAARRQRPKGLAVRRPAPPNLDRHALRQIPTRPNRSAVRAKAEQPPKPVKRASVNSCPTFSGRRCYACHRRTCRVFGILQEKTMHGALFKAPQRFLKRGLGELSGASTYTSTLLFKYTQCACPRRVGCANSNVVSFVWCMVPREHGATDERTVVCR